VYLDLAGFQFEAFTSVSLTGNGVPRLTVKLPRDWAEKLGLIPAQITPENGEISIDPEVGMGMVEAEHGEAMNSEDILTKLTIHEDGFEGYSKRALARARKIDQRERFEPEISITLNGPIPDLADAAERERLSASAVKAYVNIARIWKLTEEQALGLLGAVNAPTYHAWQADPKGATLDQETMTRISLAIGIFHALHICFGEALADQWVTLKNRGKLFAGQASPLDYMIEGGQVAMKAVRRLLDSWSPGN
jgi:hypothetical protein